MAAPQFPGRIIKKGDTDRATVRRIQQSLNDHGCGPLDVNGVFGGTTDAAVRLFQARFTDADGLPLLVDGKVGSITWGALFGNEAVPSADQPPSPLLAAMLATATANIGVMEQPPGSNRGPQVDVFLQRVGVNPADNLAWCAAFVYFCFDEGAKRLSRANPAVKTAGVLDHWAKAGQRGIPRILNAKAIQNPELVRPGHVFVVDTGGGHGHMGLVAEVLGGKLITIEGNTNDGGSREGVGVFRRESRKIAEINKGFVDYSGA